MATAQAKRSARPRAAATIHKWVKVRVAVAGAVLSLLFVAIGYKAYGLQIEHSDKYRRLAQRQHLQTVEIPAPRGPIVDAKRRELAVTAEVDSVFANPREIVDLTSTAETLASLLDLDVRAVEAKLATRRYFVWLKRHVTGSESRHIRAADLRGVYLTPEPRRFYPGRTLAGPVLGFAGIDGDGLDGIELKMDELLSGEQARFSALRDASGRVMMADGMVKPQPGASIALTLDLTIQHIAERALQDAVVENLADGGTLVVLDVRNSNVLALANFPTYDPNSPGHAVMTQARNRAITDAFEIGSVMKVFTIAAALDAGMVGLDEEIDVEQGRLQVGRHMIRDTYRDTLLTIGGIIKRSSNVGAVKIAQRLGHTALYEAMVRYGFGTSTGIELPGERSGRIRDPKRWGEIGLASISFGYGMTATPMQVAAGFASIGNGGIYMEPRLIQQVRDSSGAVLYHHEPEGRRIMEPEVAEQILPMLASVFDKGTFGGTARSLDSPSFDVGGKTGTARKVDPETRQYSKELYVSSFAGLAPIDAPRIAVVVVIDEPRGEHYYGGKVAGPAFVRVVDETLRYLGVPPKPDQAAALSDKPIAPEPSEPEQPLPAIVDATGQAPDELAEAAVEGLIAIPDFTGMGVKRALDTARDVRLAVDIDGSGRAVEQFPPAGWAPRGTTCRIVFAHHRKPTTHENAPPAR